MISNNELVTQLKRCVGLPYMWGGIGKIITEKYIAEKAKAYPDVYTAAYKDKLRKHIGERGFDCVGIIKFFLWGNSLDNNTLKYKTNGVSDTSADGLMALCNPKGTDISKMPDVPGLAVGIPRQHIGVYIGGGEVIEARGVNYGVVITKLAARPWKTWGYLPAVEYVAAPSPAPAPAQPKTLAVGDTVNFTGTKHFTNSNSLIAVGKTAKPGLAKITAIASGARRPYHLRGSGVNGWVYAEDIKQVTQTSLAPDPAQPAFAPYKIKVTTKSGLNIRSEPGTNGKKTGAVAYNSVHTIVAAANGKGAEKWGQLQNGGWIALDYTSKI